MNSKINLRAIGSGAALAAALTTGMALTAPSAEAVSLSVGSVLNLQNLSGGGVTFNSGTGTLDFFGPLGGQGVGVGASTGSFVGATSLPTPIARIQDLSLTPLGGGIFKLPATVANFIQGVDVPGVPGGNDVQFTLTEFIFNSANGNTNSLKGFFTTSSGTFQAIGRFTSQTDFTNPSTYSLSLEVVPTPALLPGLVGMGLAALRKRREEAESEA